MELMIDTMSEGSMSVMIMSESELMRLTSLVASKLLSTCLASAPSTMR